MYGPVAAEAFQTLHVHGRVLIAAECQHIRIADEDNLAAAVRIEEFQDVFKQSSRSETEQVGLRQAAVYKVCLMNYEQRLSSRSPSAFKGTTCIPDSISLSSSSMVSILPAPP